MYVCVCVCVCVCVFVCVCGKEYTTGGSALVGNPVPCRCVCGKEYHWRIHMVWNPVPCRCPPLAILSSHMEYVGRLHHGNETDQSSDTRALHAALTRPAGPTAHHAP